MKADKELIEKVAKLARLDLSEDELAMFTTDLKDILDAFKALDGLDTDGVKSSFRPIEERNSLRDDDPNEPLSNEAALSFAEDKEEGSFIGPRTVE